MMMTLMGLMLVGLLWATLDSGSSDASEPTEDDEPGDEHPSDPNPTLDTGASLTEDSGVVSVELGEDETGSLVMVRYTDTEDAGIGLSETQEARLYLLPEGTDMPTGTGGAFDGPALPEFAELEDLEAVLGLELLGSWDLGGVTPINEEPYEVSTLIDPPSIETDDPISYFNIEANADGDDLISIVETTAPPEPGSESVSLRHNVDGTVFDYELAEGDVFDGTDGDDSITTFDGSGITVNGEDGDDMLVLFEGAAFGDAGNDFLLNSFNGGISTLDGGEGDDTIIAQTAGSQAFGGAGEDELGVYNGAEGFGGAGNDSLSITEGRADGGSGDDTIEASMRDATSEDTVLTGGDGNDLFSLTPSSIPEGGEVRGVTITDFDPSEDTIEISNASALQDVRISNPDGPTATLVEVDVLISQPHPSAPPTETIRIVLQGVSTFDPANLVLRA